MLILNSKVKSIVSIEGLFQTHFSPVLQQNVNHLEVPMTTSQMERCHLQEEETSKRCSGVLPTNYLVV